MYLWLKLIHILAVVMFIGNIVTGVFWHKHAERTRNPGCSHTPWKASSAATDCSPIPGVVVILASGIFAAVKGGFPILGTGWILWTLVMFAISGLVFMIRLGPLQRKMQVHAQAGASSGSFDYDAYHRMARQWDFWGAVATLAPLIGLGLMVLKPAF